MVKINRHLLPIKAHFFFFMAAMGPILPQLSVIGKQIGVSPEVMGYVTSVLPIIYAIAKPLFGFLVDYFANFRKLIFITLMIAMTLAFGGFYFIPEAKSIHAEHMKIIGTSNGEFNVSDMIVCSNELLNAYSLCTTMSTAHCLRPDNNNETVKVYFTNVFDSKHSLNLTIQTQAPLYAHVCLDPKEMIFAVENTSCILDKDLPENCLYQSTIFFVYVLFFCIGTIGFNVINSISDAICFDMLGERGEDKYGAQRVWGTIGFGLTALLAGVMVNLWTLEAVKSFTPALVIMLIFSGFDLLSASQLKLPQLSSSKSIFKDVWGLIKHPAIGIFLIFATIAGIIDSFIIYFLFWHLEDVAAETGYMSQIKLIEGCVIAAECLAGEIPFFFYSGKIIKKLGYVHCMSMCFFFYALRLALISWIPNPWYLVVVELFFQGCSYALCYTCIVTYASAVAPPGTSATVQGLMAGMDDGLGFSIGSLIGGLTFKCYGGRKSFMYFSIAAVITCAAHIIIRPSSRKKQYLPKAEYQAPIEQIALDVTNEEIKS